MRRLVALAEAAWLVMVAVASPARTEPAPVPDVMAAMDAVARGDCPAEIKLLTAMADRRDADGERLLGIMYYRGRCGPRDYSKAWPLLRAAAVKGDAAAQAMLGEMYEFGNGVPKDYAEAVNWYLKGAD